MPNNISGVNILPADKPKNTSASFKAAPNEVPFISLEYRRCRSDKSVRSFDNKPSLSNMMMCAGFTPSNTYKLAQAKAADPAPDTTIFTSSIFFSANSKAFNKAAEEIIAVPCWSSCITGISSSATKRCSISKDSGALMSSKLIPPNVGEMFFTVAIKASMSLVSISMSNTSISAKILNNKALPSITGLDASGPISPKPNTAVPLVITATKFPLAVYLYTFLMSLAISKQGSATPGE